jgi:hypothetical protein
MMTLHYSAGRLDACEVEGGGALGSSHVEGSSPGPWPPGQWGDGPCSCITRPKCLARPAGVSRSIRDTDTAAQAFHAAARATAGKGLGRCSASVAATLETLGGHANHKIRLPIADVLFYASTQQITLENFSFTHIQHDGRARPVQTPHRPALGARKRQGEEGDAERRQFISRSAAGGREQQAVRGPLRARAARRCMDAACVGAFRAGRSPTAPPGDCHMTQCAHNAALCSPPAHQGARVWRRHGRRRAAAATAAPQAQPPAAHRSCDAPHPR